MLQISTPLVFNDKKTFKLASLKATHASAIHLLFSLAQSSVQELFSIGAAVKKAGYNNETARRQAATVALAGFREAKIALQWPDAGAWFLQGCLISAEEGYKHTHSWQ